MTDRTAPDTSREANSWPSRLEWGLIVTFWSTFALLSLGKHYVGDGGASSVDWSAIGGHLAEYTVWVLITPLVFRLVEAFPVVDPASDDRQQGPLNILLHGAVLVGVAITVDMGEELVLMVLYPAWSPETMPLARILQFWFVDELLFYFVILMAGFARLYYLQKRVQEREAERLEARTRSLEAQLTEARLDALRMQLNPHFLFNTLHAISTLVDRDPSGVRRMIARLSELLRHVLDEDAPQEVPLSQELDFLEDYLEIQSIRFQGALDTTIDVPPALHDAQVPNLIVQPLVENAIKHGASQVRGVGRIAISAERADDRLVLMVEDNGPGVSGAQEDGFGLRNARARLQGLYGEDQALRLFSTDEGTRVRLEVPYHTGTALYTTDGREVPAASGAPAASE